MGGNLQSVLLLLRANADPTLPNKVQDIDVWSDRAKIKVINQLIDVFFATFCRITNFLQISQKVIASLEFYIPKSWTEAADDNPQSRLHACATLARQIHSKAPLCLLLFVAEISCNMFNKPGMKVEDADYFCLAQLLLFLYLGFGQFTNVTLSMPKWQCACVLWYSGIKLSLLLSLNAVISGGKKFHNCVLILFTDHI